MLRLFFRIIFLIVLISAGYLAYGYYYYQKGSYRDLGVKYNFSNYDEAVRKKLKIEVKDISVLYYGTKIRANGEQKISEKFTNEEVSALINYANESNGNIKNFQIKFIGGNDCEASFYYQTFGKQILAPVYIKANLQYAGNNIVYFKFNEISLGDFKLPKIFRERVSNDFNGYVNTTLAGIDIFEIERLDINNDEVFFSGTLPTKIEGYE